MSAVEDLPAPDLPVWPWFEANRRCPLDPPPLLAQVREQPLRKVKTIMGFNVWLVTRHADARFVLSDRRFSADRRRPGFPHVGPPRPVPPGNFVHVDPPDHTRFRRIVTREFTVRTVEQLRPAIQRHVDLLIDDLIACRPPGDLKTSLALPLSVRVICELLGIPHDGAEEFFVNATKEIMPIRTSTPALVHEKVYEAFDYVNKLVGDKKREPGSDLLSRLVREMEPDGPLDRKEMVALTLALMFAGYETTSNMIALALVIALARPEQFAEVRDDPALIRSAVEEVLRYTTVVHTGLPRLAIEDVEVGGQLVRAGDGMVVSLGGANRDLAAFGDPDRFDLRRFAGQREAHHLAFGYGIHQCLGQMLARTQIQLVLASVLQRLPGLSLAVPFADLEFRHDMFLYGLHHLPVTW